MPRNPCQRAVNSGFVPGNPERPRVRGAQTGRRASRRVGFFAPVTPVSGRRCSKWRWQPSGEPRAPARAIDLTATHPVARLDQHPSRVTDDDVVAGSAIVTRSRKAVDPYAGPGRPGRDGFDAPARPPRRG